MPSLVARTSPSRVFAEVLLLCVLLFAGWQPLTAQLSYGTPVDSIGTFQTPWGNWVYWIGWDATFSEDYLPTNETYSWVVYFAPEAVYVALQSSKGLYSAVNVNAGTDYFHGSLNLQNTTRLTKNLLDNGLKSVTLSRNLFGVSGGLPGTGLFAQLSWSMSSAMTFLKEKNTGQLRRGVQQGWGTSVALDLVSLPLPISVSQGIDCDRSTDPPELCVTDAFWPVIIWNLPPDTSANPPKFHNPVDLMIDRLKSDIAGSTPTQMPPNPNNTRATERLLLQAMQLIKASNEFRDFVESPNHDSALDDMLSGVQTWLDSGDTSKIPPALRPPDPRTLEKMKPILGATQMVFELAYSRPAQSHTVYADCVTDVACKPGKVCRMEVTAKEVAALIPSTTPIDPAVFEGVWLLIDHTQESYLTHSDSEEWVQIKDGRAAIEFVQNSDAPVTLGARVPKAELPSSVQNIQYKNLELCRRYVTFTSASARGMKSLGPGVQILLLE